MAGELDTIPLGQLCLRITKGTTPTTLGRPFVNRGVNYVKSEAITDDGRIDESKFAFIDVETHKALV
jgi:type I restriction enzyme S subunit